MSRRARVTPEQAGLYVLDGDVRRVPGLRREEVADLAGVSADYYTQLERGDVDGASDSVLNAVARALRLDDAERLHLFDLARPEAATRLASSRGPIRPSVQRDPRRVHRRHGARAQPALGLPRGQRAGPRGVRGDLRRPDRPAEPRPLRVPRRPRPGLLRRLAGRGARHGSHPALRSRTRPARPRTRRAHRGAVADQRRVPGHLVTARRAPPRSRPAPVPPPARGRPRSRLRGRGAAGRPRPDASAGHRGTGLADRSGAAPARGEEA